MILTKVCFCYHEQAMTNHLNRFHLLLIFTLTLLLYLLVAGRLTFTFPTDAANYFSYQADAFLRGQLGLVSPQWHHDLSFYQGKIYMYWGPTPLLLILPIVALFGLNVSDVLYTAIIASFGPALLYLILQALQDLKLINLSDTRKLLLSLFFALGTVYFSVASKGGVWFTSQIFNTLFILISLYSMLLYLKSERLFPLLLSALFLGLAAWGRFSLVFYLPVLLALPYVKRISTKTVRSLVRPYSYFFLILFITACLAASYNYLRFGSVFETGYYYHQLGQKFYSDIGQFGLFNPIYMTRNFYYTFINPPIPIDHFPYLRFDPEGNSLLLLSPLLLMVYPIIKKRFWVNPKLKLLNSAILLSILAIIILQLNFFGTGWYQFGARYLLDIMPLLIILLAQTISRVGLIIILPLLTISVILNSLGTLWLTGVLQ